MKLIIYLIFVTLFIATTWIGSSHGCTSHMVEDKINGRLSQTKDESTEVTTAVLIDAGSVHTSVYAYDKILEEVFNCEINSEKGISSVDIEDLENYLFQSKCMKQLFELRPGNKFIVIGGTSGMRGLVEKDPKKATKIMDTLQTLVTTYGSSNSVAKILSSRDEGVYGWLTVNYLINGKHLAAENQVGSLDWGGGSSEITFATQRNQMENSTSNGSKLEIFSRSDECFGQSKALERYYALLVKDNFEINQRNLSMPIKSPCQPGQGPEIEINPTIFLESSCLEFVEGHEQMEEYLTKMAKEGKNLKLLGTGNMDQCLNLAKRLFNESECREIFKNHCFSPLETNVQKIHPNEFYAFSTYYYTASLLRLSPGTPLNLKQSWAHAKRLCTSNYGLNHPLQRFGDEYIQKECFRGVFMNVLIEEGYGLGNATIKVVNTVKGQDAGWTLGYAYEWANNASF